MAAKDYPKTNACYSQAVTYDEVMSDPYGKKIQYSLGMIINGGESAKKSIEFFYHVDLRQLYHK